MVLAASGVEHEELVAISEPLLSDLPDKKSPGEPESVYTGGDFRCQAESGVCIKMFLNNKNHSTKSYSSYRICQL